LLHRARLLSSRPHDAMPARAQWARARDYRRHESRPARCRYGVRRCRGGRMNAMLEIRGIAELKDALARLPAELKGQATGIVVDAAYAAQRDIAAAYPQGP